MSGSTRPKRSTTTRGPRYIAEGKERGFWLLVDPTLNQFPADATHVAGARGTGQAGRHPAADRTREDDDSDLQLVAGATPVMVGRP